MRARTLINRISGYGLGNYFGGNTVYRLLERFTPSGTTVIEYEDSPLSYRPHAVRVSGPCIGEGNTKSMYGNRFTAICRPEIRLSMLAHMSAIIP